ncbi:MAG: glycosyltransferase [Planctomycetota bacterium]
MNITLLIPAFNPDEHLVSLVQELDEIGFRQIVVINDGSKEACRPIFDRLGQIAACHVVEHAINLGKGRALKTGFNYIYTHFRDTPGVVTADADGQHTPQDILKVARLLAEGNNELIIGSRRIRGNVPFRSRMGNVLTRYIFLMLVGKRIHDTQSGLRGIPRQYLPQFIKLHGEHYEYELNMLITTKKENINIREEEIKTIYIDGNKSSHFNPFLDSMRIYFLLLRFIFSSIFASFIDIVVFAISYRLNENILTSIIIARFVSGNINFYINKKLVFHNRSGVASTVIMYYMSLVLMAGISFAMIERICTYLEWNVLLTKVITESVLFLLGFFIQRDIVFRDRGNGKA